MAFSLVDLQVLAKAYAFSDGQWKNLRFNIEGPAKLKVGTSMPKLAQLAGFNN